jgi:hypothetical protein
MLLCRQVESLNAQVAEMEAERDAANAVAKTYIKLTDELEAQNMALSDAAAMTDMKHTALVEGLLKLADYLSDEGGEGYARERIIELLGEKEK